MKKIITILITSFLFMETVFASQIETDLAELKNNINALKEQMNDLTITRLNKTYPVGSIYITMTYSKAEQVNTVLGGTWESYGSGKTLIGVNVNDANFNTVNKTGGSSTTTLAAGNLPSHSHSIPALSGTAASAGAHTHSIPSLSGTTNSAGSHRHGIGQANSSGGLYGWMDNGGTMQRNLSYNYNNYMCDAAGAHTHTVTTTASTTGSSEAHSHTVTTTASNTGSVGNGTAFTNLQPYITVYMYKRVA